MKKMAVISAGFVPVPAVDGGAAEVLTTYIIEGNEIFKDYYIDIYTIASSKLSEIEYKNAQIIQINITKWNRLFCKARNMFLKLFKRKYRFVPYNRALLKAFRDCYDVILIENNMQVYEDIYNKAKMGKDSMIYHMHNDIDGTTKPEYLCEFIAKTAKVILPVSNYIKNHFNNIAPNQKMKVLYNCIDLNLFDVNKTCNAEKLREKYRISKEDFVFLYTGRICPEKGILELVQAYKEINKLYPNVKLVIVGSRWYNLIDKDEYFERLIDESQGLEDKIIFTGYIFPEQMPDIYSIGDSLVIPSMWEEPFGVVALEGMAMKLPIISTNSGGLIEILNDNNAIIVDKNKEVVEGLKSAMVRIINNKELASELKEKAYIEIVSSKEFDKTNYYQNFIKKID